MDAEQAEHVFFKSLQLPRTKSGSLKMTRPRTQQKVKESGIWHILAKFENKSNGHLLPAQIMVEYAFHYDLVMDYDKFGTASSFGLLKSTYFPIKDTPGSGLSEEMRVILFHAASRLFLRGPAG
jgi:hypothetical protein